MRLLLANGANPSGNTPLFTPRRKPAPGRSSGGGLPYIPPPPPPGDNDFPVTPGGVCTDGSCQCSNGTIVGAGANCP